MKKKIKGISIFEIITKDLNFLLNTKQKSIDVNMFPKNLNNEELLYEITIKIKNRKFRIYYPFCPKGIKEFLKIYYGKKNERKNNF